MRVLLLAFILCSPSMLAAQQPAPLPRFPAAGGPLPDSYYHAVLERVLRPPEWQTSLISMSVYTVGSEAKVIIRERHGEFELLKGSTRHNIYQELSNLRKSGHLPMDPLVAASRIQIEWKTTPLPRDTFEKLHLGFTSALTKYASRIQSRYSELLTTRRSFVNIHAEQFVVAYDNKFEHIEIRADDTEGEALESGPMVKWVRAVQALPE